MVIWYNLLIAVANIAVESSIYNTDSRGYDMLIRLLVFKPVVGESVKLAIKSPLNYHNQIQ